MSRFGRIGITYEEVFEAANILKSRGEVPTIDRIRTYLGGRGSNTTISKYLNYWRDNTSLMNEQHEGNGEAPPDIVQNAIQHAWQQIKTKADQEIAAIKDETQAQIQIAEECTQQAERALKELQEQHQELEQLCRRESAQKEILILDLKKLREEYHLLEERFKALQERYTDVQNLSSHYLKDLAAAHSKEVNRLEEQLQLQENNHKTLLNEMKDRLESERHDYMRALDTIKEENKQLNKAIVPELKQTIEQQSVEITQLRADLKAIQDELNLKKNRWHK